ncbi:MAG: helix-turn-helix transcriptional regulator [Bacillota bacterium]|nr:helix-turn-helix transcriptional regulator [Bacillota bacterium]
MDLVSAIRNRFLVLCDQRGLTINKLANISAVPPSSLKNIFYKKSNNPKIITIKKLCDGLEITLAEFFDAPEFNELEQEIK